MRASIAWPRGVTSASGSSVSGSPARDAELPLDEIDAGDHLGDRVLDLQPRVHLEEVEPAVRVEQELDRAGVRVPHVPRDAAAAVRERSPQVWRDAGRRALLEHLLVAALDRALALDERQHGAVLIAEQLHFDVPWTLESPLEVHRRVAERRLRLAARRPQRSRQLGFLVDEAHALAAAAGNGLQHQRVADAACRPGHLFGRAARGQGRACRARRRRQPPWPPRAPQSCCPSHGSPQASGRRRSTRRRRMPRRRSRSRPGTRSRDAPRQLRCAGRPPGWRRYGGSSRRAGCRRGATPHLPCARDATCGRSRNRRPRSPDRARGTRARCAPQSLRGSR